MDTPQAKIARLERSIARAGEFVTFEKLSTDPATGASTIENSIIVPAWTRSSSPQDLLDTEARDIRIVVSPTLLLAETIGSPPEAFGIPKRDDRVIVQGSAANIQNVLPIYWGGQLIRINLLARG